MYIYRCKEFKTMFGSVYNKIVVCVTREGSGIKGGVGDFCFIYIICDFPVLCPVTPASVPCVQSF